MTCYQTFSLLVCQCFYNSFLSNLTLSPQVQTVVRSVSFLNKLWRDLSQRQQSSSLQQTSSWLFWPLDRPRKLWKQGLCVHEVCSKIDKGCAVLCAHKLWRLWCHVDAQQSIARKSACLVWRGSVARVKWTRFQWDWRQKEWLRVAFCMTVMATEFPTADKRK